MSEQTVITCQESDHLLRPGQDTNIYSSGTDYDPPYERRTTWQLSDGRRLEEVITLHADLGTVNRDVPCRHWVYTPNEEDE